MGYQRGERGRLASLITVVLMGAGVVAVDHIGGRSTRPPSRTEASNQVISMDLAVPGEVDSAAAVGADDGQCRSESSQCRSHLGSGSMGASSRPQRTADAGTCAIKLKALEAKAADSSLVFKISELNRKQCFLELQVDSIPPLEKRFIAAASQMATIRSVSIRIDGEVRISKLAVPTAAPLYLVRATSERVSRNRASVPVTPVAVPASTNCRKTNT